MQRVIARAQQIGGSCATTVLITGETGTGKELFARAIHDASEGAHEPFVVLNCSAGSDEVLERELLGYEPGALPGTRGRKRGLLEIAGGGTLMLDDVGALSRRLQQTLLRVLELRTFRRLGGHVEYPVQARIIALTLPVLEEAVLAGTFQAALFDQLNIVRLALPPLRERGADVALLAQNILHQIAHQHGTSPVRLSTDAVNALRSHPWPGNVRELRSVVARAVQRCSGATLLRRHLIFQRRRVVPDGGEMASIIQIPPGGKSLDAITQEAIHVTLLLTQGNLSAAARILQISRPTLTRKLRETGVLRSAFCHHDISMQDASRHERPLGRHSGDGSGGVGGTLLESPEHFPVFHTPEHPATGG